MPRNVYFSQGTTPEKRLYEDITIEALKIYGHDAYYIPRTIVNTDSIFNEDALSKFGSAYQIEMYLENTDGFEGDGDLLSKFGVEIRDSMTMVLATRRWEELIGRFQSPEEARPQEGDLIYFPLVKGLFQITYVEDDNPFYQLSNLPTFKLTCELFEYGNEAIDTGIAEVDDFETKYASRTQLTLGGGSGTFIRGEDVTQANSTSGITVTGEVSTVPSGELIPFYNNEKTHNTTRLRNWTIYQYIESERVKGNYKIYYIDSEWSTAGNGTPSEQVEFSGLETAFNDGSQWLISAENANSTGTFTLIVVRLSDGVIKKCVGVASNEKLANNTLWTVTDVTGEVTIVATNPTIDVSSAVSSDGTNTGFAVTAGSVGNIVGSDSGASYTVTAVGGFNEMDDNDPYAENIDFETIGNNFIDFTETNPFGEPDITS